LTDTTTFWYWIWSDTCISIEIIIGGQGETQTKFPEPIILLAATIIAVVHGYHANSMHDVKVLL
jgi:hypothetical protein